MGLRPSVHLPNINMILISFVISFLLYSVDALNEVDTSTECIEGIIGAVTAFTFAGAPDDYYVSVCTYNLSINSVWAAAKEYCTPIEIESGSLENKQYCEQYGGVEMVSYAEVAPLLTDSYINALQVVNFEDIDSMKIWNNSIMVSRSLYQSSRRTIVSPTDICQLQFNV